MEKLINYLKNIGKIKVIHSNRQNYFLELKVKKDIFWIIGHKYLEYGFKFGVGKIIASESISTKKKGKMRDLSLETKVLDSEGDVVKELYNLI